MGVRVFGSILLTSNVVVQSNPKKNVLMRVALVYFVRDLKRMGALKTILFAPNSVIFDSWRWGHLYSQEPVLYF